MSLFTINVFKNPHGFYIDNTAAEILNSCQISKMITGELVDGVRITNYVKRDDNRIHIYTDHDVMILDHSHHPEVDPRHEPWPGTDVYFESPFVSLHNYYDLNTSNWVYFPYYILSANCVNSVEYIYMQKRTPAFKNTEKKYRFSCLIRNPYDERIWFYCQMHRHPWIERSIASFYGVYTNGITVPMEQLKSRIDSETYDYFKRIIYPQLPICTDDDREAVIHNLGHFGRDINHPAFDDCYINIISEHRYQTCFLSEKTVKPIAAEQLFLMAGPLGAIDHLENLGFDVYRDYIDHRYYDNEPDWQQRLTKMLAVADDLDKQDIPAIYQKLAARREANCRYLFSDQLRTRILDPLVQWININM